jgi:hypothetical protein
MWSEVGRSLELAMISPLMDRAHVGHLLGALVHEEDHQVGLGWFSVIAWAMRCSMIVLPAFGGRDDEAALPEADGRDEVEHPGDHVGRAVLELDAPPRVHDRQVLELRVARGHVHGLVVHALDALQLHAGAALVAHALQYEPERSRRRCTSGRGISGSSPPAIMLRLSWRR